jgi:hypothetical protein
MAKIKVTNLKNVTSAIKKEIIKASRDKSIRSGIGDIIVEDIQNNPVRSLSSNEPYYKFRQRIKNKKDGKYNINNLNFTIKGSLMKDLRSNVRVNTTNSSINYVIEHSDKSHTGYSVKKTKRANSKAYKTPSASFKDIQKGLASIKPSYNYLKFSSKMLAKLDKFIKNKLIKLLT